MESIITCRHGVDKSALHSAVSCHVDALLAFEPESEFAAEKAVWSSLLAIGRLLLSAVLAQMCWRMTMRELASRERSFDSVRFRLDADYSAVLTTTLGRIVVPLFAYREPAGAGTTIRCPARHLLPWYPRSRSSRMALRFETLLGSRFPFRHVEGVLALLTHGAMRLHDTTIASHCAHVAAVVEREHMYLPPNKIREILVERAVCDEETGRPIAHFSTDQHAERLLEGTTWNRQWKMLNGIRIWCIDKRTGKSIPLGGEFIVGDCHAVADAFDDLACIGVLPFDGDYGDGVVAQLVFVADGMPWFDDHVLPKFPGAVAIVDAYHVLEKAGDLFAELWGSGSRKAKKAYGTFCRWVTGRLPPRSKKPRERTAGTPKRRTAAYRKSRCYPTADHQVLDDLELPQHSGGGLLTGLFDILGDVHDPRIDAVIDYIHRRVDRVRYAEFWHRGFHISSAAMESFHRIAQQRIKLPGAAWTPAMAQAILNLRMMNESGNDERFWNDEELMLRLGQLWRGETS